MADTNRPTNRRRRSRVAAVSDIKRVALRQMAERGAAAFGVRELARELDVVPSALYRYFAGRDGLLTALIIDAYDAVGLVVETAIASVGTEPDYSTTFVAAVRSMRAWAHARPEEWHLIFGSPIPNYQAPPSTFVAGARAPRALLVELARVAKGADRRQRDDWRRRANRLPPSVRSAAEMRMAMAGFPPLPVALYVQANVGWTILIGLITMDISGQLSYGIHTDDTAALVEDEARRQVARLFLPPAGGPAGRVR